MVVFPPSQPPTVLTAYSTVPLQSQVRDMVQKDFDNGAFARFRDPRVALQITDRSDFHQLSNLEVREFLDLWDFKDPFVVIDSGTATSRAVWYVTSTEESKSMTKDMTEESHHPPISYANESFVLWQLHLLAQDLPLQWINWDVGNTDVIEDIAEITPYDPHSPQNPPFTLGHDFSNKTSASMFIPNAWVKANSSEIMYSEDLQLRRNISPRPPAVIRLTPAAAREAGLISSWMPRYVPAPLQPGEVVTIQVQYDWDSPKWAWDGADVATS